MTTEDDCDALLKRHSYEEAINCLDKVLELNPKNKSAWVKKAIALSGPGKYEEAIKCYDKAIKLDPRYDIAWQYMGFEFENLSRYEEAIKCYGKVLEINPKDKYSWDRKGSALEKLGRNDEAVKCYDKILELDPKYEAAINSRKIAEEKCREQERIEHEHRLEEERRQKEESERHTAQENIKILETVIEKARSLSLEVPDMDDVKRAFESQNYTEAAGNSKKITEQIEMMINNSIPGVLANLKNTDFKIGAGKKVQIEIRNTGKVPAKNISAEISSHQMWDIQKIAVKMLSKIESLKPDETNFIDIWIKSDLEGEMPVEFLFKYTDSLNRTYQEKREIWINVGDFNSSVESREMGKKEEHQIKTLPTIESLSYLSLERSIYEPLRRDFIISTQRPLPNVKNWIEKNDPSMYWLVICVNNNSDKSIDEWGIELETPATLKVLDARIEGTEHTFNVIKSFSKPWLTNWILGVPHHHGIVIPRKGSKRIYFKLGSDACGVSYSIKGKVSTSDCEVPIKEKHFKYSCDTATLNVAIRTNPEEAENYAQTALSNAYNKETALKLLHSFRIVQEIDRCCSRGDYEDIKDKLELLLDALESAKVGNKVIQMVRNNFEGLSIIGKSDASAKRAGKLCSNLVDTWINEVLGT